MIGGTSIFGGVGGYVGTIFGVLMMTVLDSLLTILGAGQASAPDRLRVDHPGAGGDVSPAPGSSATWRRGS